jgi:enediyne biosynthesis protein E4
VSLLDADNDGDLDVYIANQGKPGSFYRNLENSPGHRGRSHWLGLDLVGDPTPFADRNGRAHASTADAISARAVVSCGGTAQRRDVQGGTSFAAQSDRRLFFGLGACAAPTSVTLFWPSGRVQELDGAAAAALVDRTTRVEEKIFAAGVR